MKLKNLVIAAGASVPVVSQASSAEEAEKGGPKCGHPICSGEASSPRKGIKAAHII